jgi:hypothetical protein
MRMRKLGLLAMPTALLLPTATIAAPATLMQGQTPAGAIVPVQVDASGVVQTAGGGGGGGGGAVTQSGSWIMQIFGVNGTTVATAVNPFPVYLQASTSTIGGTTTVPSATGGVATYSFQGGTGNAALTNSVVQVGTTAAHSLYGVEFINTGAATAYVQVFDLASGSVTLGTSVPKWFFWVPAGGAYEVKYAGENRILFSTAMSFAATTTVNGSTAPSTAIIGNVEYL